MQVQITDNLLFQMLYAIDHCLWRMSNEVYKLYQDTVVDIDSYISIPFNLYLRNGVCGISKDSCKVSLLSLLTYTIAKVILRRNNPTIIKRALLPLSKISEGKVPNYKTNRYNKRILSNLNMSVRNFILDTQRYCNRRLSVSDSRYYQLMASFLYERSLDSFKKQSATIDSSLKNTY